MENGIYVGKYFSSFIGFFPADNPELCIAITLDEPKHGYYGGTTAAPVFKQMAERAANYLNIPSGGRRALPVAETAASRQRHRCREPPRRHRPVNTTEHNHERPL